MGKSPADRYLHVAPVTVFSQGGRTTPLAEQQPGLNHRKNLIFMDAQKKELAEQHLVLLCRGRCSRMGGTCVRLASPVGQAPTVPKKILARCGMLRHAAACFKLLVKGTIIFRKRHRFVMPR